MSAPAMPTLDLARHARHITLPQVGIDGQRSISRARVALLGETNHPGLVSARAYLEAAGVHAITETLDDEVDVALVVGDRAIAPRYVSVRARLQDGHPVIESTRDRRLDVDPPGTDAPTPAAEQAAWTAAGALAACEVLWRICATTRKDETESPVSSR